MTSRGLISAQYHREHYTLQAFEQFGALYMHNLKDTLPTGRASNPIPLSFEPQLDRIRHRDWPILYCQHLASPRECVLIKIRNDRPTPL